MCLLSACTVSPLSPVGGSGGDTLPEPSIGTPADNDPVHLPPPPEQTAPQSVAGNTQTVLNGAVDNVIAGFGGRAEVAVSGQGGEFSAGDAAGFASWSTIKVPIAIAALKEHPEMAGDVASAITVSDNDAAMALWNSVAPEAVETVLAEGGTPLTVQRERVRLEFSPFGQTVWSVVEQARFASNLQCVTGSEPVLNLMGGIAADQSYGLGTLPGARFKGGWGPSSSDGAYEVRQFGLVHDTAGRNVAVAVAVTAGDGSYESGQVMATHLVAHIAAALDNAPAANC
nr:Uncharacterised protein [Streptococcus thermophilus]